MGLLRGRIRPARLRRPRTTMLGLALAVAVSVPGVPAVLGTSRSAATARSLVGVAFRPQGGGWKIASDGHVVPFGGARTFGSVPDQGHQRLVAIASTADGRGYWVVRRDGHVFGFGDAVSYGSFPRSLERRPSVVSIAALPDGRGYWLLTSTGRVVARGAAKWYGAPRWRGERAGVAAIAATPDGRGYWTLSSRGSVFAFGDARWGGSPGDSGIHGRYVGLTAARHGFGYWVGAAGGTVRAYGAARRLTSPSSREASSVVSISTDRRVYGLLTRAGSVVQGRTRYPVRHTRPTAPSTTSTTTAPATSSTTVPATSTTTVPATTTTTVPATTTTTVPATTTTTAPPQSGSHELSFGMFARPLPAGTSALASSQEFVADFVKDYQTHYGAVAVNQMPVLTVSAGQAPVPVSVKPGCGNFTVDTGKTIPIPAAAATTGTGDSPLVIDQPSTDSEWELWQASRSSDGGWSACWGGKLDTAVSQGVFPDGYGLSGSGISYLATTITEADVASGSIDHAIALDLPACTSPQVYPADRTDCSSDPGQPPEGTWWRFPAGLRMPSGLTPFGQMVFRAIQDYGLVQTDQAGAVALQAENTTDWAAEGHSGIDPITASWQGEAEWQVVANLPWGQLEAISAP